MSRARDIANYGDGIDRSSITSGTFADARIAASNITQHEGSIDALASNPTIQLGSNSTFPSGHVIQTQYYSAGFTFSTSSTNFVKVTGSPDFEQTITPLKADSNIMIIISSQAYSGSSGYAYYSIYKNASDITETTNISGVSNGCSISYINAHWNPLHYTFIDTCSENSLSTKTYAPSVKTNAGTAYFGDSTNFMSTMVLMEIAT